VASLKDRLSKVETLLKAAGILHEDDISPDELSDDDYDRSDEKGDLSSRRPQSSGQISQVSFASRASNGEVDYFPSVGDVEATPMFKSHERDDSRYYGSLHFQALYSTRESLTVRHRSLMFVVNAFARRN
jgi:hypothetical protein